MWGKRELGKGNNRGVSKMSPHNILKSNIIRFIYIYTYFYYIIYYCLSSDTTRYHKNIMLLLYQKKGNIMEH